MEELPESKRVQVIVPVPVDNPFTYEVPPELAELAQTGMQVIVPFGNRYLGGIIWKPDGNKPDVSQPLKPVKDIVDSEPFIGEDLRKVVEWIAGYYVCHLGEAIKLVNPAYNLNKSFLQVRKMNYPARNKNEPAAELHRLSPPLQEIMLSIPDEDWISIKKLENACGQKYILNRIYQLRKKGLIITRYEAPSRKQVFKKEIYYKLNDLTALPADLRKKYLQTGTQKSSRSRELIDLLQSGEEKSRRELLEMGFSSAVIRKLVAEKILCPLEKDVNRRQENFFQEEFREEILTDEQQEFVNSVDSFLPPAQGFKVFLLHGITGSGKTRIYIELISRVIAAGRQAIVLIPEIVLTPQTMARFTHYFGERVAVIHSRLSPGEKTEILYRIRQGDFDVVIGPRSAVFAPLARPGIIIVDEEHESSYKQTDAIPRYNARDVAIFRAYVNHIPVILGSATPGFESLYNAMSKRYEYFHLSRRISARNLPRSLLIDLKEEWHRQAELPVLSENLILKIESRLIAREQVMLLQNRRGFSPYILCKDCGYIARCPNCDITLTYHFKGTQLRCHYCGHQIAAPTACPQCQGLDILFKGIGTQKIEEQLRGHFPHARILRMDQDTTGRRHGHAEILEKFRNGEADILIGTKMIAKGLDFERVTLVGIISADQGLQFPDFRATEKVFQLLTQAAGRAGRGASSGEVVIQTFEPNHYIFKYLGSQNYLKFYHREIETRQTLSYPPFSRLCLLRIIGKDEIAVQKYADKIARFLWQSNTAKKYIVLGPAPAPLFKINNRYRYQILLKQSRATDESMSFLRKLIKEGIYKSSQVQKWPVQIQIDVDPLEIM